MPRGKAKAGGASNLNGFGGRGRDLGKRNIPPSELPHVAEAQKAYWTTKCALCGAKALYRAGRKAYCKDHKYVAAEWWAKHPMRIDLGSVDIKYGVEDAKKYL